MTEDIKDIHWPVEFPVWGWILIALAVILIATALWWFLKSKKNKATPELQRDAWDIALDQLQILESGQYPIKGEFKVFYSTLSDIVRQYLENRFGINAPEMTTEEFLNYAQKSAALNSAQQQFLKDFLSGCDMVKFAKYTPTTQDAQQNFDLAKKLIIETKLELKEVASDGV